MNEHEEIKTILSKAPYCPVCYYVNQEMKRQFRWLFIQYARSYPFIFSLMKGGLCHVHSLEVIKSAKAQDMSLCYKYLVENYRHKINTLLEEVSAEQKPPSFFMSLFKKKERIQKPDAVKQAKCPLCKSQRLFQDVIIAQLLKALSKLEVVELYRKSPGLCRIHLEQALNEAHLDIKKLLIQIALEEIDKIADDFREYFHKLDYRYSEEPKGEEQNTWLSAMQFYDSYINVRD